MLNNVLSDRDYREVTRIERVQSITVCLERPPGPDLAKNRVHSFDNAWLVCCQKQSDA